MTPLLDSPSPIVAAPMAGGPTSPALVRATITAGAFPFLPAGYRTPDALADDIRLTRAHGAPFGVNVFAATATPPEDAAFRTFVDRLRPEAERFGLTLDPVPRTDDDHWAAKIDLLRRDPVPVVSFTFGLPSTAEIAALRRAGSRVLATVTTVDEARAAHEAGVDGLIVQGPEAGGHSGTFTPTRTIRPARTSDVVRSVRAAVPLPLIAAGGVDGSAAVAELLAIGAEAVAVGTLLLRTDEAGTSATHRAALADPSFTETVQTHAFTGRPARALRNDFIDRYDASAPFAYPALHHLTRPIRQAAAAANDPQRVHLWAGTGFRRATDGPASAVFAALVAGL
ncbi:NAD(P)H-dependent flavin oxidoreductase [Microbacterium gorillae]|uniref:NAD(P)H-dependent flavin oxidoreductase n=1 Tax=Microbacterium gorillae TaxID=1231063 RepID=UPI00058DB838|nr:nitronate monooxygenase [Microbacterium gorillae]